jgi:hypothetical protein
MAVGRWPKTVASWRQPGYGASGSARFFGHARGEPPRQFTDDAEIAEWAVRVAW